MDYWESGMHLAYGADIFESFCNYQRRLIREFNALAKEFNFITIDARKSPETIQRKLREHIGGFLRDRKGVVKEQPAPQTAAAVVTPAPAPEAVAAPHPDFAAEVADEVEAAALNVAEASK